MFTTGYTSFDIYFFFLYQSPPSLLCTVFDTVSSNTNQIPIIFFAVVFTPLKNFGHIVFSVSIDFPSNSNEKAPFRCTALGYSYADWDSLWNYLRDVPWEDVFKLGGPSAKFCEWIQFRSDIDCRYKVKPHTSVWFSAAFAATMVQKSHFLYFPQHNKSSAFKVKFRQSSNCCKKVSEVTNLVLQIKQKSGSFFRKLVLVTFRECL